MIQPYSLQHTEAGISHFIFDYCMNCSAAKYEDDEEIPGSECTMCTKNSCDEQPQYFMKDVGIEIS